MLRSLISRATGPQMRSLIYGRCVQRSAAPALFSSMRRSYAATAAEPEVQVSKQMFSVPGKYATSLFVVAAKADTLDSVGTELKQVMELSHSNQLFHDFLMDPSVPVRDRIAGIEDISKTLKFSSITTNFLALLAENQRMDELHKIGECFVELLMAHRGEVHATVTSALELTPQELADIKGALQGRLKPGQTLSLSQKVDRSIIGGLVIEIGEKMIDMSIRTKMNKMQALLSAPLETESAEATA